MVLRSLDSVHRLKPFNTGFTFLQLSAVLAVSWEACNSQAFPVCSLYLTVSLTTSACRCNTRLISFLSWPEHRSCERERENSLSSRPGEPVTAYTQENCRTLTIVYSECCFFTNIIFVFLLGIQLGSLSHSPLLLGGATAKCSLLANETWVCHGSSGWMQRPHELQAPGGWQSH